jgi:hypothetical protein
MFSLVRRPVAHPNLAMFSPAPPIDHRLFADGKIRPVYVDRHGQQYVFDDSGRPVYDVWVLRVETELPEPIVVSAK